MSCNCLLRDVEAQIGEALSRLNRPDLFCGLPQSPRHDGSAHVEVDGENFLWIYTDFGQVTERYRVDGPELVFVVLEPLTRELVQQVEIESRGSGPYSRWRWMEGHIRMMRHLSAEWGDRVERKYRDILRRHPLRTEEELAGLHPLDLSAFGVE